MSWLALVWETAGESPEIGIEEIDKWGTKASIVDEQKDRKKKGDILHTCHGKGLNGSCAITSGTVILIRQRLIRNSLCRL